MEKEVWRKMPVAGIFAACNIIVFLILEWLGSTQNAAFMVQWGAMFEPYILEKGEYWRLITSMFLHFGIEHLANNMLMLLVLGSTLEPVIGSVWFALVYLISGVGANGICLILNFLSGTVIVSAGASGAVFGIIGCLFILVLRKRYLFPNLTPKKMMLMIALSLYHGFASVGVNQTAHISGLLFGMMIGMLIPLHKKDDNWRTKRW